MLLDYNSTSRTTMKTYGCHNTERQPGYYAPQRAYGMNGVHFQVRSIFIEDRTSKDCRYDQRKSDPSCEGCAK